MSNIKTDKITVMPLERAITLAEEIDHWVIWTVLISRPDFPLVEAVKICEKVDHVEVWEAFSFIIDRKVKSLK